MAVITVDTNILVRATMNDDPVQSPVAQRLLGEAELVAIPTVTLCEFAWVLGRTYRLSRADVARALRGATKAANTRVDHAAVMAGLSLLDAGADFADGVIAHAGFALGGRTFASFDHAAVERLNRQGIAAFDPSQAL